MYKIHIEGGSVELILSWYWIYRRSLQKRIEQIKQISFKEAGRMKVKINMLKSLFLESVQFRILARSKKEGWKPMG